MAPSYHYHVMFSLIFVHSPGPFPGGNTCIASAGSYPRPSFYPLFSIRNPFPLHTFLRLFQTNFTTLTHCTYFLLPKMMKTVISLCLATLSLAQNLNTIHAPSNELKTKRGFLTCQETYGGGSTTCGGATSRFCYDPTLGEVRPFPSTQSIVPR